MLAAMTIFLEAVNRVYAHNFCDYANLATPDAGRRTQDEYA